MGGDEGKEEIKGGREGRRVWEGMKGRKEINRFTRVPTLDILMYKLIKAVN